MQAFVLVVTLIGAAVAAPAKLQDIWRHARARQGYSYNPPPQPSGLYELPAPPTTTTTTTTTTPRPRPPPQAYLPPDNNYLPPAPSNQFFVQRIPEPPPKPAMMLMPYKFQYRVDDEETGNKQSHVQNSDGRYVTGQYSVLLPDGRTQIVKFTSSPERGYEAEVIYQYL